MLTTLRIDKLRDYPKALAVQGILSNDLPRFASADAMKAVDAFNGRVETHGKKLAAFTATLTALAAGNVEGDPVKLAKELGSTRVSLAADAVSLREQWATLRDALRADFAKWKKTANAFYHSQKRILSDQALAVAGGRTVLAEQIAEASPRLSELQSDSYWDGPWLLREKSEPALTETRFALALAITDAAGLTVADAWHNKMVNTPNDPL